MIRVVIAAEYPGRGRGSPAAGRARDVNGFVSSCQVIVADSCRAKLAFCIGRDMRVDLAGRWGANEVVLTGAIGCTYGQRNPDAMLCGYALAHSSDRWQPGACRLGAHRDTATRMTRATEGKRDREAHRGRWVVPRPYEGQSSAVPTSEEAWYDHGCR